MEKMLLTKTFSELLIKSYKEKPRLLRPLHKINSECLIIDLHRVANILGQNTVPYNKYKKLGYYSEHQYLQRFGKWNAALTAAGLQTHNDGKNPRQASPRLRYLVMLRDNHKCVLCGASPANNPKITLHIDHIIPHSKGGNTSIENLQTLCSLCNLGKSDT
jgi:hypothetical protein